MRTVLKVKSMQRNGVEQYHPIYNFIADKYDGPIEWYCEVCGKEWIATIEERSKGGKTAFTPCVCDVCWQKEEDAIDIDNEQELINVPPEDCPEDMTYHEYQGWIASYNAQQNNLTNES